jgi:hypothetical protein
MGNVTVTDEVSTPATPADGVTLYSTGSELRYIDEAGDVHVLRTNQTAIATADITDNAVTNAKLADSAVGTTEIADNAVTAVKIANANITTAKLAALAVPSANLVADPHTLLWPVSAALQGGLARWYVPAGLTAAAADGSGYNTPYTIGAANGGRLLYLSEMALIPDDVVSLALDVVIPIGRQARINLTWRTSVGGTISTTSGSYVNGTGNLTRLSLENQTIPPTAAQIALYFGLGSGSGNINVHGWIVIKGASLTPTNIANLTSGDASTIMMRLAMASFIAVDGTIAANAITTTKIIDDAVTNAKLANMTRGTVKVGGTSNEPTDLDAKTSGRILVGDGTDLKSVAVSGDATITSAGVVTVPRGAPANIVWDTFNELAVGDLWDSRPRWYAADNLSIAEADVDNPYANKQRTLILGTSGNGGGKYIWFDEAGLKNGDTVQFKALVMAARGTFLLAVRPIDATGTLIGSQANGGAVVQDGTTKIISNTYTVVDATAAGVALYFVRSAGAVDLAIYATWGSQVTTLDYPPPSHRPYAAHTYAFPMQQQEYGRGLLRNWHRKIASLALGNAEQIVMAMIGDSWFDSSIGVVNKLIPLLQTAYGDAGPGYVGFAPTTAHGLSTPNVTLSKAGTWDIFGPGRYQPRPRPSTRDGQRNRQHSDYGDL